MNHITVVAHGAPHSFARRVQENPNLAVVVLWALRDLWAKYEAGWDDLPAELVDRVRAVLAEATGGPVNVGKE